MRANSRSTKRGAQASHHTMVHLLFASTRTRKDIQTTIAFLTVRLRFPDKDNWGKIKRMLKYVRGTVYIPLILRAESLIIIKWWVDASFATH
jgi:hypothetical protein